MANDYDLTVRHRMLRASARTFSKDVLSGVRHATESATTAEERFAATKPAYEALVAEGFLLKSIPESAGGQNRGLLETALMAEEFYAVDASVALTLVGTVLGLLPVVVGGTPDQQKRLLEPFLTTAGAPLAAFCSSEPGGSANTASPAPGDGVRTTAVRDGESWIITGQKKWISSATGWKGEGADLLCVLCRTDPEAPPVGGISIIALPRPDRGLVLDRAIESVGHKAHLLPEFTLDGVRAANRDLLGSEGAGLELSAASFAGASALVGILGVALMRSAFEFALDFAKSERRGGVDLIIEHQVVGYALADAKMNIEAARSLAWRACAAIDAKHPAADELANYSKIFGSETAVRVITDLMRVVGIDSYDSTLPMAGWLQDALALPIFSGGNMGVRRRQVHGILKDPAYDPLSTNRAP